MPMNYHSNRMTVRLISVDPPPSLGRGLEVIAVLRSRKTFPKRKREALTPCNARYC